MANWHLRLNQTVGFYMFVLKLVRDIFHHEPSNGSPQRWMLQLYAFTCLFLMGTSLDTLSSQFGTLLVDEPSNGTSPIDAFQKDTVEKSGDVRNFQVQTYTTGPAGAGWVQ